MSIPPGATLGVLGGGQLGRMFAVAARTLGYRLIVHSPVPESPAGWLADEVIEAPLDDRAALARIAERCDAVTVEFENIPADSLRWLAERVIVRPSADALAVAQDRRREKAFAARAGLAITPTHPVEGPLDLEAAWAAVGGPSLLKAARFGYDGKGQARVGTRDALSAAFDALGGVPCVLERRVDLAQELSVVLARGADGAVSCFPLCENVHRDGILHTTVVPARVAPEVAARARAMAIRLAEALDYVGVLAVELFVSRDGELLFNELAPRPHNSGHYTLDACLTSQFEQQVRALCGLPLGGTDLLAPAAMVNLLGDLWANGEPDFAAMLREPRAKLHLYGKAEARPGRKMGHVTVLADTADAAHDRAEALHAALARTSNRGE